VCAAFVFIISTSVISPALRLRNMAVRKNDKHMVEIVGLQCLPLRFFLCFSICVRVCLQCEHKWGRGQRKYGRGQRKWGRGQRKWGGGQRKWGRYLQILSATASDGLYFLFPNFVPKANFWEENGKRIPTMNAAQ